MKNIRKRQDGRWEGRIYINGKRKSCFAKTQNECYKNLQLLKKQSKKKLETSNETFKLYNFAKYWLETFKKVEVKESTYKMYENLISHLSKLNKSINSYTTEDLQVFLNSLGQTRIKELVYQVLKQIFKKALQLDYVKKDVAQFLIKGKIEKIQKRSFTLEEQRIIMSNLRNNTISKYILAYLLLGARLSELKSIKKENIKEDYVLIEGSKTKNAHRWVKVSQKYKQILMSYKEPIFNCQSGTIKAKMREFFENVGIKGSTHMLRHTFSTNLYYLGADDNTRKQYLGHSSIVVTNDIYTHLDPTIKKEDIIKIYDDLYPKF